MLLWLEKSNYGGWSNMKRVSIFSDFYDAEGLQQSINKFLTSINGTLIDVKFQVSTDEDSGLMYHALVIYEDNEV